MSFKPKCPHEGNITYEKLIQINGCPQYYVTCDECGQKGIIYLSETEEDWNAREKKKQKLMSDEQIKDIPKEFRNK